MRLFKKIKTAVIDAWLRGKPRDEIAVELDISKGSVSNIVKEWENGIGVYDTKELRVWIIALKKAKISPLECAKGLKIYNMLYDLDINDNNLLDFLDKFFKACDEQKILPAEVVGLVKPLIFFTSIKIKDIPEIIQKYLKLK